MNKRYNIIVNRFNLLGNRSLNEIHNLFQDNVFVDEIGYGFKNTMLDNDILYSKLLYKNSTYIMNYNSENEEFERRVIYIYSECDFFIDFNRNIIYSTASNSNFNTLKSVLYRLLQNNYSISSTEFLPYKLIELFKVSEQKLAISELNINNFVYKDGAIGRYNMKINKQSVSKELIEQYKNDISRIKFTISTDTLEEFCLSISKNGLLNLDCEKNSWELYFEYIKKIIF